MSLPRWIPPAGLALLAVAAVATADPQADDREPLPKGAKVRFGSSRLAFRFGTAPSPVPPDYTTFLVPDAAGGLWTHDLATGRPVGPGNAERAVGGMVVVSADGKRAVSVRTGVLTVRDVATGEVVAELRPTGPTAVVAGASAVSLSADGSVLAQGQGGQGQNARGEVVVWDVAKAEPIGRVPLSQPGVGLPVLSPDGTVVATRGLYSYVQAPADRGGPAPDPGPFVWVWEATGGKELFKARVTAGGVQTAVAFSPDGKSLATAAGDGPIDLYSVPSGKPLRTILGRTGQGARVAFSPDGTTLAAVARDGTIQRWTMPDGQPVGATDPPAELPPVIPQGIGFATGGRVVAWGTAGALTVAWEAPSGKLLTPLGEHLGPIQSIAFPAGGKEVVTAGRDGRIVRWDAATGRPLGTVVVRLPRNPAPEVSSHVRPVVTLSLGGERAFSAVPQGAVYDPATGAERFAVPRGPVLPRYAVYQLPSADLTRVAVLSVPIDPRTPGRCVVWDVVEQAKVAGMDLTASPGTIPAAGFSPDGSRLVTVTTARDPTGRPGAVVTGWDLTTGKKLSEIEDPANYGSVTVAVASDTSAVIATGGQLWAVDYEAGRKGDVIDTFPNPDAAAGPVAFSPDGTRFAAGVPADPAGGSWGVRVYDWPRGTLLHTFAGHAGPVTALTFSPDGKTLASGSGDTTVLLWDVSDLPAGK